MKKKTNITNSNMLYFLLSEESADTFLSEMPHFSLDNKHYYDLQVEDHVNDTPDQFIRYIVSTCKNNAEVCDYLKQDEVLKKFTIKYFGKSTYIKIIKGLS